MTRDPLSGHLISSHLISSSSKLGWSGAFHVYWNCIAGQGSFQSPPLATNWVIGYQGKLSNPRFIDPSLSASDSQNNATMLSTGTPSTTASLYLWQLKKRLGSKALAATRAQRVYPDYEEIAVFNNGTIAQNDTSINTDVTDQNTTSTSTSTGASELVDLPHNSTLNGGDDGTEDDNYFGAAAAPEITGDLMAQLWTPVGSSSARNAQGVRQYLWVLIPALAVVIAVV